MAIKRAFGSALLRKPGAYSQTKVDNAGGAPLGANTVLFLVGESTKGAPGDVEGIQEYSAEQLDQLVAKYGSGPIVDCALVAVSPSKTPGVGGAGRIMVWKTNSSTQATRTFDSLIIKDRAWGSSGNDLSVSIANGSSANQKMITINKLNGKAEVLGENQARPVISLQYAGAALAVTAEISGISESAKKLIISRDGVIEEILLANFTMKQLADFLDAKSDFSASLGTNSLAVNPATDLDPINATDVKTSAQTLYRAQKELAELINQSSKRCEAELVATPVAGLPANIANAFLTGGAQGPSTNADFSQGFAKSLSKTWNASIACISRDATEDIGAKDAFTDSASTYTIAAVQTAQESHIRLRGQIKNRKEAQGFSGIRKASKSASFSAISGLGSELMQVSMQDALVLDQNANLSWKGPHVFAAMCAGIRLGTSVGEPLTFKHLNCLGVGHFVDPETGMEMGDFDAVSDVDDAIDNGVLFAEPATGGHRIVVDNTTYGADQSFVWNRGSVVEASQFIAKTLRETAEMVFVGGKVSNGMAKSIKTVLESKLRELNAPDVNITTASEGAPEGWDPKSFVVTVSGNTARVQVKVIPVQGLDFVLIDFTLGDIKQSA